MSLLEGCVPPCHSCEYGDGSSPLGTLRQAVAHDHVECVLALVSDRGYDVHADKSPASAYHSALMATAIANGSPKMVHTLLQLGVETSEDEWEDCLMTDNSLVFGVLLSHRATNGGVKCADGLMAKALSYASDGCVKVLLDFGVPADGIFEGQSYLEMAVGSGSLAVCRCLLASMPSSYISSGCLLHRVVVEKPWTSADDLKTITALYLNRDASMSVDAEDADGSSLLTLALDGMKPKYAAFLLQLGAPIREADVSLLLDCGHQQFIAVGGLLSRRCEWNCPLV